MRNDRRYPEKRNPSTDHRERHPAKRDRDRLLYCNSLQRLAGVTQVTSPVEGHQVHNRLTHTLKVAQIARRLTERLLEIHRETPELIDAVGGLDPEAAEAAALAHDVGHPPFGHIGEEELNRLLLQHDGEEGYEGNAQSFRIVTRLAVRSTDEENKGLNLTRATLNAVLKYPWLRNGGENSSKWGAYETEQEYFHWVRSYSCRHERCIEAQIMDWADDTTYAVHDAFDFFRAGKIPLHLIARDRDERMEFLSATRKRWSGNPSQSRRLDQWNQYEDALSFIAETFLFRFRRAYSGTRTELAHLSEVTSELITRFINDPALPEPDSNECPQLHCSDEVKAEVAILKALNWHYVIQCPALRTQQHGLKRIISDLYEIYLDGGGHLVPTWVGSEIAEEATPPRKAADIVSSLSDSQATRIHQRLTGLSPGSIHDWM